MQDIYVVGGHVSNGNERGNVFTIPCNKFAEFNMFLDPLAAKAVFTSGLNITLIPLSMQKRVNSFPMILRKLQDANRTPEASLAHHLLATLWNLQQKHNRYHHMVRELNHHICELAEARLYLNICSVSNITYFIEDD